MRRKCSITPTPLLNLGGLGVHFDATYSVGSMEIIVIYGLIHLSQYRSKASVQHL